MIKMKQILKNFYIFGLFIFSQYLNQNKSIECQFCLILVYFQMCFYSPFSKFDLSMKYFPVGDNWFYYNYSYPT